MQGFTRSIVGFGIGLLGLALATPALATDPHLPPGYTGDSSAVANATAIAGASATATGGAATAVGGGANVTNVNTNVNAPSFKNENSQGQGQVQGQHQKQGQSQGQVNNQQIAPSQSVSVDASTNFDRYAPSIAAPALTSAGANVCLGSFSVGLAGPMAGVSFGKTVIDTGCESRSGSLVLMQYSNRAAGNAARSQAFENASLRVLAGESLKDALKAEGLLPTTTASAPTTKPAALKGNETVQQTTVIDNRGPAVAKTALEEKLEQMQGM